MTSTKTRIMNNNKRLTISIALMTTALILGGTLSHSSADATTVVGKNGGIGANGANGGHYRGNVTASSLNGANGKDANGESASSK